MKHKKNTTEEKSANTARNRSRRTACRTASVRTSSEWRYLCSFNVAGVQFSNYGQLDDVKVGHSLTAAHERSNRHDSLAIKLFYDNIHIGYVPKGKSQDQMWKVKRAGKRLLVKLKAYNYNNPTWSLFYVDVYHEPLIDLIDEDEVPF